jgi:ATP-dependent RNA helicase DeaD
MAEKSAEDIAAALVHAHRALMPQAEDLLDSANSGAPQQTDRTQGHRPGFEDTVWFQMDIGRRQNADPRWLLPLICRRGHITKAEIGAIRINPNDTIFEVPRTVADRVLASVQRTANPENDEGSLQIIPFTGNPREAGGSGGAPRGPRPPRDNAARPPRTGGAAPARHQAKPYRKGPRG